MMGFMTLVMSIFSIVPMAISLSNRDYLARVVVYMLKRYGRPSGEDEQDSDQVSLCRTNEMSKLNLGGYKFVCSHYLRTCFYLLPFPIIGSCLLIAIVNLS